MLKKISKNINKWVVTPLFLKIPRSIVKHGRFMFTNDLILSRASYNPKIYKIKELYDTIKKETEFLLAEVEAIQIYMAVLQTSKIDGSIAEVGVFRGGSAKLISEIKGNKKLHLFDTFEGLPPLTQKDDANQFHENQFASSLDDVKNYLKNYQNLYFYKGIFPSTAGPIDGEKFSFVHLDVDLYEPTLECLKYFYPRMNPGGIIISHDYLWAQGVRMAFDEFFQDKPEPIIELEIGGSQCLVVKS